MRTSGAARGRYRLMPNAVPAEAAAALPPARMIDPRGHRFGAAVSGGLLIVSFLVGWVPGVVLALLSIGVSAAFGLRYSIYGAVWRRIVSSRSSARRSRSTSTRRGSRRRSAASRCSSRCSRSAWVRRRSAGSSLSASPGSRSLLAVTGYCLGCRMYFLRWWIPDVVTSIWTRGARRQVIESQPIRYG